LDIRSFFDKVGHDHLEKFLRHRIGDERFVRLILKWVKAGVMEDGQWFETKEGTPQGAVISPLLANLYLYHVLDLWVNAWRKKRAHGDVIVVRYADDAVLGFQYREEAEKFLADLQERIGLVEGRVRKVREQIHAIQHQLLDEDEAALTLSVFDPVWESLTPREQARVVQLLVQQVAYDGAKSKVSIAFHPTGIKTLADELARQGKEKSA
jgi:hypothetical protein